MSVSRTQYGVEFGSWGGFMTRLRERSADGASWAKQRLEYDGYNESFYFTYEPNQYGVPVVLFADESIQHGGVFRRLAYLQASTDGLPPNFNRLRHFALAAAAEGGGRKSQSRTAMLALLSPIQNVANGYLQDQFLSAWERAVHADNKEAVEDIIEDAYSELCAALRANFQEFLTAFRITANPKSEAATNKAKMAALVNAKKRDASEAEKAKARGAKGHNEGAATGLRFMAAVLSRKPRTGLRVAVDFATGIAGLKGSTLARIRGVLRVTIRRFIV